MWGDEMRVGLRGRVCRVWAPRGAAVSQEVRTGWKYTYVAVAIDPLTGQLWWAWQKNMKGEEMARIWGAWAEDRAIDGWVRDGDGGHKGEAMQAVDAPQVVQPPHAPELNPVERFFRELRRAIEGKVYPDLQARQEALEEVLNAWQAIRRGCGGCAAGTGSGRPSGTCPTKLKWHKHHGLVLGQPPEEPCRAGATKQPCGDVVIRPAPPPAPTAHTRSRRDTYWFRCP